MPAGGNCMTQAIDRIQSDHRNTIRLLQLLEREARHLESGAFTDFPLISDIMRYVVDYSDLYHHPLEDEMFALLKKKDRNRADSVDECHGDHERLAQDSQALLDRATQIQGNAVFPREQVVKQIREFVDCYRKHMKLEEDELLPAAKAALDANDWRAVAAGIVVQDDPLFGKTQREEFKNLYKVILAEAGNEV